MKLKLFKKFFFITALIISFSLTVMMVILSFVINNYLSKTKYATLKQCCFEVTEYISENSDNGINTEEFYNIINTLSTVSNVDIFVTDNNGTVLICGCEEWLSESKCYHSEHLIVNDNSLKNENGYNVGISTLKFYKTPHYVSDMAVLNDNNEQIGFVFSTAPLSAVRELMATVSKLYLISAILPIILMFFAIYAMTYSLTKPLKMMSEASRAMARGDFSKRIPVMSDDEIGELSVSFNQMTNSLVQLEGMRRSFVANVSHELKTPMTTIGGFIDGILDGTIEPERQNYYLNIVSNEVKRLSRLVHSMLSMAKLESGEFVLRPELFDLRELLCTVVISQEQRIEKQQLEIIGLDEALSVSIKADKDLIYQVIYNLVDNAIKFTDQNGSINFSLKVENKFVVFKITNTGKGISQSELPFVFDRFYKADKSRSANKNSTGLGLYIVKTIVNTHGGSITVTSKENEFTSFTVTLPKQ